MSGSPARPAELRASTLIELLLALALLALVAALFISGGRDLARARELTPTDVFWQAVQSARLQAIQDGTTVTMRFDEESHRIVWGAVGEPQALAWPGRKLEFLREGTHDAVLLGGQLVESATLPAVRFHPDGTTDRFRVQLTDAAGQLIRLEIDPWTAAPVVRSAP